MPIIVEAALGGKSKRLGAWIHPADGPYKAAYDIAHDAKRVLEGHYLASEMLGNNDRLSAKAKRADTQRDAADRLKSLGGLQNRIARERAALDRRAGALKVIPPYRDGDFSTVQIDLALAAHVRGMDPAQRTATLLMGFDARLVEAVLRLPAQLSGVDPSFRAKVEAKAIERQYPDEAEEIASLREAVEFAQGILRNTWKELEGPAALSGFGLDDQVEAAGGAENAKELMRDVASPEMIDHIAERVSKTASSA